MYLPGFEKQKGSQPPTANGEAAAITLCLGFLDISRAGSLNRFWKKRVRGELCSPRSCLTPIFEGKDHILHPK